MGNFWQKRGKQNHLTTLEVRRAVWNGACYVRRLPWQGEERPASSIQSGFIPSPLNHFTSATWRRFHRRRLLHATDFLQAAGFTVRGGVSVMAEKPRNRVNKSENQRLTGPGFPGVTGLVVVVAKNGNWRQQHHDQRRQIAASPLPPLTAF
jgi:hypothetical protein